MERRTEEEVLQQQVPPMSSGSIVSQESSDLEDYVKLGEMRSLQRGPFNPGPTSPISKMSFFEAELDVHKSLKLPKVYHANKQKSLKKPEPELPWLTREEKDKALFERVDYSAMLPHELKKFRQDPLNHPTKLLEKRTEMCTVQALARKVKVAKSSTEFSKIKTMTKSRQQRHAGAVEYYKQQVVLISEEIEFSVISEGQTIRDTLAEFDDLLNKKKQELKDDQRLRTEDYEYLTHSWTELDNLCTNRKKAITDFGDKMESLEKTRSKRVGEQLRNLLDNLVDISYVLQGEVERLIEEEAHEINFVIISNLKCSRDVLARMLKKQAGIYKSVAIAWDLSETRWRHLRHSRALEEWSSKLSSETFTDPPERQKVLKDREIEQKERHDDIKLNLLTRLEECVPKKEDLKSDQETLPELTDRRINEIKNEIFALCAKEKASAEDMSATLDNQELDLRNRMNQSREDLRAELHTYAALAENGDIFTGGKRGQGRTHKETLSGMVNDPELEDFFRKGGGIKAELSTIVSSLGKSELIYNNELEELTNRVNLLVEARTIANQLETQGKDGDFKALETTLEKLRVAKKADIAPLVPQLYRQTRVLKLAGLGPAVDSELKACLALLCRVQPDLAEDNMTIPNRPNSGSSGAVSINSKSSKKTNMNILGAEMAYKEKPLNLVDLRAAQKRIGTVINAAKLHDEFKSELVACLETLKSQLIANKLVDEVIETHTTETINKRASEILEVKHFIVESINNENTVFEKCYQNICDFFLIAAKVISEMSEQEQKTDYFYDNALDTLLDTFENEDSNRENLFKSVVESLYNAPNKERLNEYMKKALTLLNDIEQGYRNYHSDAVKISEDHPNQVEEEFQAFLLKACTHFRIEKADPDHPALLAKKTCKEEIHESSNPNEAPEIEDNSLENIENRSVKQDTEVDDENIKEESTVASEEEKIDENDAEESVHEEKSVENTSEEDNKPEKKKSFSTTENEEASICASVADTGPEIIETQSSLIFVETISTQMIADGLLKVQDEDEDENDDDDDEEEEEDDDEEETEDKTESVNDGNSEESQNGVDGQGESSESENLSEKEIDTLSEDPILSEENQADSGATEVDSISNTVKYVASGVSIPVDTVARMIKRLRDAFINVVTNQQLTRKKDMEVLYQERYEEFTEELEERLRLHWPRKGRTDVKCMQPRAGQLMNHQQKHDRHIRSVMLKNSVQQKQVDKRLEEVKALTRKFKERMKAYALHMEVQNSAAALQGLLKRGKDTLTKFNGTINTKKSELMQFVRPSNELFDMNNQFLLTCVPFKEGGDYNSEEIEIERVALEKVGKTIHEQVLQRAKAMQELFKTVKSTQDNLSKTLNNDFERCLQTLSVRDGLGKKYGAPRRNAQEKLRSEITKSDSAEQFIDNLLNKLSALSDKKIEEYSLENINKTPLSVQIVVCLDSLRKCLHRRACYFEFLLESDKVPTPDIIHTLTDIPVQVEKTDEDDEETISSKINDINSSISEYMKEEDIALALGARSSKDSTFFNVVNAAAENCRQDTRDLYEREGMLDELKNSKEGLPDSLVVFLNDLESKALKYKLAASFKLRDQMNRLQDILLKAPGVALGDTAKRSMYEIKTLHTEKQKIFKKEFKRLQYLRRRNEEHLRPQMANPNYTRQLEELDSNEKNRASQERKLIVETRKVLYDETRETAQVFGQRLLHCLKVLLHMLDTITIPDDTKALPGDDQVQHKRMGLKRLQRVHEMNKKTKIENSTEDSDSNPSKKSPGRHLLSKTWEGINIGKLKKISEKFSIEEAEANDSNEDEQDLSTADYEETSEAISTFLTPQHRNAVSARERQFDHFVQFYEKLMETFTSEYEMYFTEESTWTQHWTKVVDSLKTEACNAGGKGQ